MMVFEDTFRHATRAFIITRPVIDHAFNSDDDEDEDAEEDDYSNAGDITR